MTAQYRDTRDDAIQLIIDEAEGVFDRATAEAQPDPEVPGCWLVTIADLARGHERRRFLVYVEGHPSYDPRMGADWEEVDG